MKILITESCLVNFGDDRGGIHQDVGDMPDAPKEVAAGLIRSNRAIRAHANRLGLKKTHEARAVISSDNIQRRYREPDRPSAASCSGAMD